MSPTPKFLTTRSDQVHPTQVRLAFLTDNDQARPALLRSLGTDHGLAFLRERVFAQDYARTLADWRDRFWASWDRIVPLGFDERFRKLWEFYLHYCEAGFRAEYIDVRQVVYKA